MFAISVTRQLAIRDTNLMVSHHPDGSGSPLLFWYLSWINMGV